MILFMFPSQVYSGELALNFDEACSLAGCNSQQVKADLVRFQQLLNQNDYNKALGEGATLLSFFETHPELQKSEEYAFFLYEYGVAQFMSSQYKAARSTMAKAAELWENINPNSDTYKNVLLYFSDINSSLGDRNTARQYLEKVEKLGVSPEVKVRYLLTKGNYLIHEQHPEEALAAVREIENPTESVKLLILNLRFATGEKEQVVKEVLEEYEALDRITTKNFSKVKAILSILTKNESTLPQAIELGEKLLDFYKERNLELRPDYMMALHSQGLRLQKAGKLKEAQEKMYEAWNLMDKFHKDDKLNRITILESYSDICYLNGDYEKASVHALNNNTLNQEILGLNLLRPEGRRDRYWKNMSKWYVSTFPKINVAFPHPLPVQYCYNALLIGKGMMNLSNRVFAELANDLGGEALENYRLYETLLAEAKREPDAAKYVALKEESDKAFDRFTDICLNSPEYQNRFSFKWQDVAKNLKPGESAVEFFEYEDKDGLSKYGACFIADRDSLPRISYLFDASDLEKLDSKGVDERLWETVWSPLEKFLGNSKRIYFSPAGQLNIKPIEYAPNPKGTEYVRLTSTRNLIGRDKKEPEPENITLYGGLTYRMTPSTMRAEHSKYPPRRDFDVSYLRQGAEKNIEPLEGTLIEVEDIAGLVTPKMKSSPRLFTGREGVEESFKALSGESPSILHVATHGFFFDSANDESMNLLFELGEGANMNDIGMMRSGLLLSGANKAFAEGDPPQDTDDGILTALEISELDLGNTRLAVLSACETGLGEISGDGVAGLQSAFKRAGVDRLILSLWKVDDQATSALMKEFYRQWLIEGKDMRQALINAQESIRNSAENPHWNNPDYWAAFILLDEI